MSMLSRQISKALFAAFLLFCCGANAQSLAPDQRPHHGTPGQELPRFPSTQVFGQNLYRSPLLPNFATQSAYVFNNNPAYLTHLTACLSKVKSQTANCNIAFVGDSVMTGAYSTTLDWTTYSIPSLVSYALNANGIVAEMNNSMGFSIYTADPRIAFPSGSTGWSCGSSPDVFGGVYCENNANSNPITFTPILPVDTFTIYYVDQFTTGSVCTIQIDGTTVGTITIGGTTGYLNATFTAPLGLHTLSFFKSSGGECLIAGIDSYDSSFKQAHILNGAWNGSSISSWTDASTPYSFLNGLTSFSPALTVIMPGINDWVPQTDINSYKASMQKIINAVKAVGSDVILLTSNPSQIGSQTLAVQQRYVKADYEMAIANNLPLIDTWSMSGSWEAMSALGLEENALHLNGPGQQLFASALIDLILQNASPISQPAQPDRVTSADFNTTSATLADIPGLTYKLVAGATYKFKAVLNATPDVTGGQKYAMAGTATATNVVYQITTIDNVADAVAIASRQTALASSAGQAGSTSSFTVIEGTIIVNAAGTLTVQFAQNTASGTSTILKGSSLSLQRI